MDFIGIKTHHCPKQGTQALFLVNLLRLSFVFCRPDIFLAKNNTVISIHNY